MNDRFDELAKGLAQSVTRRGALKKFTLGLAGLALAALGVARPTSAEAAARWRKGYCQVDPFTGQLTGVCVAATRGGDLGCPAGYSPDCLGRAAQSLTSDAQYCYSQYDNTARCRF